MTAVRFVKGLAIKTRTNSHHVFPRSYIHGISVAGEPTYSITVPFMFNRITELAPSVAVMRIYKHVTNCDYCRNDQIVFMRIYKHVSGCDYCRNDQIICMRMRMDVPLEPTVARILENHRMS